MRLGQFIDYIAPGFSANARYASSILQFLFSHVAYDFWVVKYNFFFCPGTLLV
jgi:hypothetical protein